mmetsp:Transcript_11032/g.25623  ORF Transcript_11032/g.25623 Transcript_11032/m.25623 type:complete len:317 (+) Transcript_11032:182-1132(+)
MTTPPPPRGRAASPPDDCRASSPVSWRFQIPACGGAGSMTLSTDQHRTAQQGTAARAARKRTPFALLRYTTIAAAEGRGAAVGSLRPASAPPVAVAAAPLPPHIDHRPGTRAAALSRRRSSRHLEVCLEAGKRDLGREVRQRGVVVAVPRTHGKDLRLGLRDDRGRDLHLAGRALHLLDVVGEVRCEHGANDVLASLVRRGDSLERLGEGLALQVLVGRELCGHRNAGGLGELSLLGRAEVLLLLHNEVELFDDVRFEHVLELHRLGVGEHREQLGLSRVDGLHLVHQGKLLLVRLDNSLRRKDLNLLLRVVLGHH